LIFFTIASMKMHHEKFSRPYSFIVQESLWYLNIGKSIFKFFLGTFLNSKELKIYIDESHSITGHGTKSLFHFIDLLLIMSSSPQNVSCWPQHPKASSSGSLKRKLFIRNVSCLVWNWGSLNVNLWT